MGSISPVKFALDRGGFEEYRQIRSRALGKDGHSSGGYLVDLTPQAATNPLYIVFKAALCHKGGKICEKMQKIFKKGIDFIENFAIIG